MRCSHRKGGVSRENFVHLAGDYLRKVRDNRQKPLRNANVVLALISSRSYLKYMSGRKEHRHLLPECIAASF